MATDFSVVETSIGKIHRALEAGELTCRRLVELYLRRIEAYDQPTRLNSIILVNPGALRRAQELDEEYARTGVLRPLHGVPVIVKDNYDTHDLPTSAGCFALKDSIPPDDAFQVRRIREAGAIVLAKSNMAEWAFSPHLTESSLGGTTRNPYDLGRVPAGSSGGTAAAVAANLAAVGLGTDTGNSIRGPSSHCCLVGIRSTMGLTSRDGIVPLNLMNDIGGPLARTVEDAARVLEAIAGYDPADPITERCRDKLPESYTQFLEADGLKGARIGVFRHYTEAETTDPQVKALFDGAVADIEAQGALVVDPFEIPDFEELSKGLWKERFRVEIDAYLAALGDRAQYRNLKEIVDSGLFYPPVENRLRRNLEIDPETVKSSDVYHEPRNIALREGVLDAMEEHKVDAFIYPTWSNPPRKIGDMESPHGDNSQRIPPGTGLPALTVPMGFTYGNLPAGLQIVGRLFGEPDIIRIAYAYEQSTGHRQPPSAFPDLA